MVNILNLKFQGASINIIAHFNTCIKHLKPNNNYGCRKLVRRCTSFSPLDDAFVYLLTGPLASVPASILPRGARAIFLKYKSAHLILLVKELQRLYTTLSIKSQLLQPHMTWPWPVLRAHCTPLSPLLTQPYFFLVSPPNTPCSFCLGSFALLFPFPTVCIDYSCLSSLGLNASERPSLTSHPVTHCLT